MSKYGTLHEHSGMKNLEAIIIQQTLSELLWYAYIS
jgi:hypothetical protein